MPSARRSFKARFFNPQFQSATAAIYNTAATSVTVTLPTRDVKSRMILFLNRSSASTDAIVTATGWTELDTSSLTGSAASFCRAYYQDATQANVGTTTAAFTGGTSTLSTSLVMVLTGCDLTVAPVANGTVQNSNTTTVDPGSLTGPNSGATQRNLWIAYVGTSTQDTTLGGTPAVTVFPTGYTDTGTSTTTDVSTTNGCGQGWGTKVASAGSDDPSTWTYCPNGTGRALAINVAVRGVIG